MVMTTLITMMMRRMATMRMLMMMMKIRMSLDMKISTATMLPMPSRSMPSESATFRSLMPPAAVSPVPETSI